MGSKRVSCINMERSGQSYQNGWFESDVCQKEEVDLDIPMKDASMLSFRHGTHDG